MLHGLHAIFVLVGDPAACLEGVKELGWKLRRVNWKIKLFKT
jgi:hypothetical protein